MSKAWPQTSIGSVAKPIDRLEIPQSGKTYRQIGVRLWGQGAYERESIDGSETKYKTLNRVKHGDIIVNKIWARNGSVSVVSKELEGCYCSGEFPIFEPILAQLEPKWFYWITKTHWFWEKCDAQSRGTSGKNRIRPEKFMAISIPLPPLLEQQRIVAEIERLAGKIEEARKLRQNVLDNNSKLLVAMAHRADLTNADKKNLGWKETILGELLTPNVDPVSVMPGKLYKTFGIYSFAKGIFSKAPLSGDEIKAKTLYRVHKDQFIYARLNAFEGAVGVITESHDQHFVSNEYPTFDCEKNKILPEFLLAYFSSSHIWQQFLSKSRGIGSKSGNRRIRVKSDVILDYQLILPPMEWQHKIKKISDRQKNLKAIQAQTTVELDALLPSILDKAFKGEL